VEVRGPAPNSTGQFTALTGQWWVAGQLKGGYRFRGGRRSAGACCGFAPDRLGGAELGRSVGLASQRLASVCHSLNQELGRVRVLEIALLHA
jgi:hypothetical protein